MSVLFAFYLMMLLVLGWLLLCNNRTCRDRNRVLYWLKNTNYRNSNEIFRSFDNFSYNQHLWHRMTFRDPWPKYGPETFELVLTCGDKSL